jgi:hypothetical protein
VSPKHAPFLTVLAVAFVTFPTLANADTCPTFGGTAPTTCFYASGVVNVYYGTLTLDAPNGTLISTTNIETAATDLGDFGNSLNQLLPPPAAFVALFPTLVGQLQGDPQTAFANIPSWVLSGLTNLADTNGFGLAATNANPLQLPYPGVVAFDAQLANVPEPYTTTSDTGFLAPPTTAAYCTYLNSLVPGAPCTPQTVPSTFDDYAFTYALGPDTINADTYTSLVNFQIFYRDVTEQLVATPEPSTMIPLALGFAAILAAGWRARIRRANWLAVLAAAFVTVSGVAKADTCSGIGSTGPTCFFSNGVVYLYYGTLTLDAPNGTLISTTNIETAEGGLADFSSSTILNAPPPPGFVSLFPSLVPQLESDPQTSFANIPSWALSNLVNLADANGFGFVPDPSAFLNEPPDPAVVSFESQLANVGGPFITTSDTGFQTQPFSLAACEYVNALLGITTPCVPGPPETGQYEFTYQLGPYLNSGNTYTSFVNFQIYSRDVTEQLVATPEPALIVPMGVGFAIVGLLRRKSAKRA